MPMKWWGWGEEGETFPLPDPEGFWAYVHRRLGETGESSRIDSLEAVDVRPSRLEGRDLEALRRATGEGAVVTDATVRAVHSFGKGYCDVVRLRQGDVPNPTDAVVWPETEEQVAAVLDLAARRGIPVIPFGGGTSVVGGLQPVADRPCITLHLGRLHRILAVDTVADTVTAQAGILGPSLEQQLNSRGFTLGHFPQSFQYSSLGGWIATRSAGQKSTLYGKIDKRLHSLRMLYPGGDLSTPEVPAAAAGPDLNQAVAGSEGVLGVITHATMRLAPLPEQRDYRGYLFQSFHEGIEACRELVRCELRPAVLRLSDEPETETTIAMRAPPSGQEEAAPVRLALLILGFEGNEREVRWGWEQAESVLSRHGGQTLGRGPGEAWERSRYDAPYLRDLFLDHGIMADTLETATTWGHYLDLYRAVRDAMSAALGERGVVMAHLSHSYSDGGSIYYTFLAPQERDNEVGQWQRVKSAATQAIVEHGGSLSHHHGIGTDHQPWMAAYLGAGGARALAALKQAFDPRGIMNPGKLLATPEEATRD
jgi:alkyldihydroxyacetonephosphate synthase